MRINLNNSDDIINKVSSLCDDLKCSPTQLIITLINKEFNNQYAQMRCKEYDKENSDQK